MYCVSHWSIKKLVTSPTHVGRRQEEILMLSNAKTSKDNLFRACWSIYAGGWVVVSKNTYKTVTKVCFLLKMDKQSIINPWKFHTHQQQLWSFYRGHVQHDQHAP
jgi:hypothetical protein